MELKEILESEEVKALEENNSELLNEAEEAVSQFPNYLKSFVMAHPDEFISESREETAKKISVFSEVATAQFMKEMTSIVSEAATIQEAEVEAEVEAVKQELNEYL